MSNGTALSENLSLQVKRMVKARRHRVFDAWTKPELMHLWFAPGTMTVPHASADLRVGGAYRVEIKGDAEVPHVASGVYQEIVPNELLRFTWGWQGGPDMQSVVTVEFKDVDGGTEVILTHERLPDAEWRDKHEHGWIGCLANLARVFDGQ
jgi:uncharacterized protein YndB with AHSA1/START domain